MRQARDLTNPSREGVRIVKSILRLYVKDLINDRDYEHGLVPELLDVIRAERRCALRAAGRTTP